MIFFFFFQILDRSNMLLDLSKLWLKIWFESAWLDCYSIDARSIECDFRLILIFRPIENRSESFFLKNISFSRVLHYFKTFQKLFGSLSSTNPTQANFCCFPSIFSQGFCLLAPVRSFYPFFFSLISFFMHLRDSFEPIQIWGFWSLRCFLSKLINGFLF